MVVSCFSAGVSSAVATKLAINDVDRIFYTHIDDHHEDTIMYGVWIAQRKSGKWRWVWKTEGVDNMKHATATVLARMIGTMKARAKLDGICGNAELEAKGRALIAEAREAMADDAIDEEVTV